MTMVSGTVKPVDYHPDASQPNCGVCSLRDRFFRSRSSESERAGKQAAIEQGHRRVTHWLISLAVLISFLIGILCLMESATPRTDGNDQLDLAAEGAPSHAEVTIGEAIQALSVRH